LVLVALSSALPVLFLVIFASVFRGQDVAVPGGRLNESVYYVPGIIVFGVIAARLSNLTVTVVRYREVGIYKRRRATPVPASAVIIGRALVGGLTALALTAVLLIIGWAGYGASISNRTAPAFVLDILVGAVVFSCLGFALASLVHNADAAQPVVQAIVLPLSFISGVFIPILELPHWLIDVGDIFPVRALAAALLAAYNPHTTGSGLRWGDLAVLTAWGAAGLLIAIRRFSWLPRGS
jgi:ABC-2 type transport system permease protein